MTATKTQLSCTSSIYASICALCLLIAASGCQTVHWSKGDWEKKEILKNPFKKTKEVDEFGVPERMAILWKDGVYENNGMPTTRGFGGRIYFYNADNETVKVDGELTVYGYNDSDGDAQRNNPDHKYVFKQDVFQKRYSQTDIGHSYSIWIPWDEVGGEAKQISLIPIFKSTEGIVVRDNQSVNLLPGRKSVSEVARTATVANEKGEFVHHKTSKSLAQTHMDLKTGKKIQSDFTYMGYEPQSETEDPAFERTTTIDVPSSTTIRTSRSVENTVPPMLFNQMQELAKKNAAERIPTTETDSASKVANTSFAAGVSNNSKTNGAESDASAENSTKDESPWRHQPGADFSRNNQPAVHGKPGPLK